MDKNKAKKLLSLLSTSEELDDIREFELQQEANNKLDAILEGFTKTLESNKESNSKISKTLLGSFGAFIEKLSSKLDEVKGTISTSFDKNKPINSAGVYKDMINQLSSIDESIKKKPVPVWNWPQYASVGVRDKSFSNIDPSLAYQHNTTTVASPYGTTLAYNEGGTIKVVSSTDPLPVDATVTLASSSLVGLEVSNAVGSVGDGTVNLTIAGTAQQVSTSSVPCKRVIITAHESNAGTIVVGGSTVVGALAGRRGKALFSTQSEIFYVNNLNLLYFDGTTTNDDVHYYYEN